ncbi:MAG: phosphatidylinositol mannoside acyltransferase [Actinomycetota bacterium]
MTVPQQDESGSYRLMRTVEWLGMRLPRAAGLRLGELTLLAQMRRSPEQRAIVEANVAQVLGHPAGSPLVKAAVEECYRLYGRYWYETFALRTMPPDEVDRRFVLEGREHIDHALEAGKGLILALPHMGNWDAAGHWLCLQGYRMTAVAEVLKPASVYELFLRHRRALGMGIVPLSDAGKTGRELVRLLGENEIITLVADRDLTGRGVRVEMFGAPRLMPAGPAYLALMTGTPMGAAAVFTTKDGWHCIIEPPLEFTPSGDTRADVTALTQLVAERFERFIAASPTDWHMFQPAWEELPPMDEGREASPPTAAADVRGGPAAPPQRVSP